MGTDWDRHWNGNGKFLWGGWNWAIARAYKKILKSLPLNEFSLLELGAGSGANSLTVSKVLNPAEVTLVDFNHKALDICKKTFVDGDVSVNYVYEDILKFNSDKKFDVVHSEGLIEHFYGKDRLTVFQKHADLCRENGYVIIFVPYESLSYTGFEVFCKICGVWRWDEKIFTRQEVYDLCKQSNLKVVKEYTSPFIHEIGILAQKVTS